MSSEETLQRAAARERRKRAERRARPGVPALSLVTWGCGAAAIGLWGWAAVLLFVPVTQTDNGSWVWCGHPPAVASEPPASYGAGDPPPICDVEREERVLGAVAPLAGALPPSVALAALARRHLIPGRAVQDRAAQGR